VTVNYVVHISDWNGNRKVECETVEQVWEAIGSRVFGGLYKVTSSTDQDCSEFIPF
jgi:hypothetical protein